MGHFTAVMRSFGDVWEASVYECTTTGPILVMLVCGSLAFVLRYEELARARLIRGARGRQFPRLVRTEVKGLPALLDDNYHA